MFTTLCAHHCYVVKLLRQIISYIRRKTHSAQCLSDKLGMVETGSTQVVSFGQLIWLTHPAAEILRQDCWGQLHPQRLLKQHRGATDP